MTVNLKTCFSSAIFLGRGFLYCLISFELHFIDANEDDLALLFHWIITLVIFSLVCGLTKMCFPSLSWGHYPLHLFQLPKMAFLFIPLIYTVLAYLLLSSHPFPSFFLHLQFSCKSSCLSVCIALDCIRGAVGVACTHTHTHAHTYTRASVIIML